MKFLNGSNVATDQYSKETPGTKLATYAIHQWQ